MIFESFGINFFRVTTFTKQAAFLAMLSSLHVCVHNYETSKLRVDTRSLILTAHSLVFPPHRMGKTTLLNHIAERKLAIPPRIDVLLCEQEVVADDTPAIDAVLKADTKRLELLAEEKKLVAEGEAGDDSNSDRLKEVRRNGVVYRLVYAMVCIPSVHYYSWVLINF